MYNQESWTGRPRNKPSMSFGMPPISYHPSSITRPKPPHPKDYRADPREANLMTYQLNNMPNDQLIRRIAEVPRIRFFTRYQGEDVDPMLLNMNYRNPAPFPDIKRPEPPPFPLPMFDLNKIDDHSSENSRISLVPKRPSYTREFSKEETYDADRLDAERKGAFFSRRSAKTQLNIVPEKKVEIKKIVPLAEQVRHWERHLRDKTSKEKLIEKRKKDVKDAADVREKLKVKEAKALAAKPRPDEDDWIHRLVRESRKHEQRAHLELSTLFNIPPAFNFPLNATTRKAEETEMELITPFNVHDILKRDKSMKKSKNYNYKKK